MTKLAPKELAGVTLVGLALGTLGARVASSARGRDHMKAMVVSGAALYVLGVVIGASRPPRGWTA